MIVICLSIWLVTAVIGLCVSKSSKDHKIFWLMLIPAAAQLAILLYSVDMLFNRVYGNIVQIVSKFNKWLDK